MTVSGELCCVALHFCCVVVALPFLASLGVIVHVRVVTLDIWRLLCVLYYRVPNWEVANPYSHRRGVQGTW